MLEYQVRKEELYHTVIGHYTAYGIAAVSIQNGKESEILYLADVFTSRKEADELVWLCNKYELDPIHLTDVVENFIG